MAGHPLQSKEWGRFREATGVRVVRDSGLQVTIHPIPHTRWSVGYLPKGPLPDRAQVLTLEKIARENNCIYIKCEPLHEQSAISKKQLGLLEKYFVKGRSLFTKYNFVLDVSKSESELLKAMRQKTRYNIRLAAKKGVMVAVEDTDAALERYLELTKETTKRQKFYAHNSEYHRKMFAVMQSAGIAHLLTARYKNKIITTWVVFRYGDTLYYPYGASSREYREVMANNLVMWEAIRLAKKWGLTYLDMWGALGQGASSDDPWYGFHTFKEGYGARHVEYIGTWDYVAIPWAYYLLRIAEWVRWKLLRMLK